MLGSKPNSQCDTADWTVVQTSLKPSSALEGQGQEFSRAKLYLSRCLMVLLKNRQQSIKCYFLLKVTWYVTWSFHKRHRKVPFFRDLRDGRFPLTDSSGVCDGARDCQKYWSALYVSSCHDTGCWREKVNIRLANGQSLYSKLTFFLRRRDQRENACFRCATVPL